VSTRASWVAWILRHSVEGDHNVIPTVDRDDPVVGLPSSELVVAVERKMDVVVARPDPAIGSSESGRAVAARQTCPPKHTAPGHALVQIGVDSKDPRVVGIDHTDRKLALRHCGR
jgi:hypothetical protein